MFRWRVQNADDSPTVEGIRLPTADVGSLYDTCVPVAAIKALT
jgi:hypothetical protein